MGHEQACLSPWHQGSYQCLQRGVHPCPAFGLVPSTPGWHQGPTLTCLGETNGIVEAASSSPRAVLKPKEKWDRPSSQKHRAQGPYMVARYQENIPRQTQVQAGFGGTCLQS